MRTLYVIKLSFQISGKKIDYSTEIIVTTGKPRNNKLVSGKQEN